MTQMEKKYKIKWDVGKATIVSLTSEQAANMKRVKTVKAVILVKK